jgi:hypothetical protein
MSTEFCPECHQPLSDTIHGIRLPYLKARIFRYIETHPGLDAHEIGRHFDRQAKTMYSHIYQINDYFLNTDIRITGGKFMGYVVQKDRKHD